MYSILQIFVFLFVGAHTAKVPRIYNVLISSKKELSPSHTVPVYEPVIRTTAISYAFPHIIYQPFYPQFQPLTTFQTVNVAQTYGFTQNIVPQVIDQKTVTVRNPQQTLNDSPRDDKFIDFSSIYGLPNTQLKYSTPEKSQLPEEESQEVAEEDDPQRVPFYVNFKKNPEIPDVPPPPLPTRNKKSY